MQRKVKGLPQEKVDIALPELSDFLPDNVTGAKFKHSDTLVVKGEDGQDILLMKAVKDDETGEMVATDVIEAAVVTARFRNKAERNGKVDLEFEIRVPHPMLDAAWEMTLQPTLFIMGDVMELEPVLLTGKGFRRIQEKGYSRYHRYESHIVTDSAAFIRKGQLARFAQRNMEEDGSWSGVDMEEAADHYTQHLRKQYHQHKWDTRDKRFNRLVKVPIPEEGVRMDSVLTAPELQQDFVYTYVQTIKTRPNLRKVNLVLSGEIRKQEKRVYTIPPTDSLTFYISTLSSFHKEITRYKTQIVYRRAAANTSCRLVFPVGKDQLKMDMADNAAEADRIKGYLHQLIANETYDLDSIVVSANCSPEGYWDKNAELSARRSASVTRYFESYMDALRDSVELARGFEVDAEGVIHKEEVPRLRFISRASPENWDGLDQLVAADTVLTAEQHERYNTIRRENANPDRRERLLQREAFYRHFRDSLYPLLRTVSFDFHLHRKGMVKDTVQTTVEDDVYAAGLQALKDRDYDTALELLAPYNDYNTAVAYLAMDRNYSALQILEKEEQTAEVNYMLAILRSRIGDTQGAVQAYMEACRQKPMYISRGNLDPEISVLIKTYGLNKQEEEDFW